MSYGLKYYTEFLDIERMPYKILLFEKDFAGAAIQLVAGYPPFIADIQQNGKFDPIAGTAFEINLITQGDFNLSEIYTFDERKVKFELRKDPDNTNDLVYTGYLVGFKNAEKITSARTELSITASCGLGQLRNQKLYDANNKKYIGKMSRLELLAKCLQKTGLDLPFSVNVDWWFSGQTETQIALDTKINTEAYYGDGDDALDCLTILKDLANTFNAEVFQENGMFHFRQIESLKDSAYIVQNYTTSGAKDGNNYVTGTVSSVENNNVKIIMGSGYNFESPKLKFTAKVNLGRYKNLLYNPDLQIRTQLLNRADGWGEVYCPYTRTGNGSRETPYLFKLTSPVPYYVNMEDSDFPMGPDNKIGYETYVWRNAYGGKYLLSSSFYQSSASNYTISGIYDSATVMTYLFLTIEAETTNPDKKYYYLDQDGTWGEYQSDTNVKNRGFVFIPQAWGGRSNVAKIKNNFSIGFDIDSLLKTLIGPQTGQTPQADRVGLVGLRLKIFCPLVYNYNGLAPHTPLNGEWITLEALQIKPKFSKELQAMEVVATNDLITSMPPDEITLLTADLYSDIEVGASYTPDNIVTTTWKKSQTTSNVAVQGLLELVAKGRAFQFSKAQNKIEGSIVVRNIDCPPYKNTMVVLGFTNKKFKQLRRRYDVYSKIINDLELIELL